MKLRLSLIVFVVGFTNLVFAAGNCRDEARASGRHTYQIRVPVQGGMTGFRSYNLSVSPGSITAPPNRSVLNFNLRLSLAHPGTGSVGLGTELIVAADNIGGNFAMGQGMLDSIKLKREIGAPFTLVQVPIPNCPGAFTVMPATTNPQISITAPPEIAQMRSAQLGVSTVTGGTSSITSGSSP